MLESSSVCLVILTWFILPPLLLLQKLICALVFSQKPEKSQVMFSICSQHTEEAGSLPKGGYSHMPCSHNCDRGQNVVNGKNGVLVAGQWSKYPETATFKSEN